MTNTKNNGKLAAGTWVKVAGVRALGQICYHTPDGAYGVGIQGERTVTGGQRVDEWPRSMLTPVAV